MRRFAFLAALLLLPVQAYAADLTVFAASSLTDAMKDVAVIWKAKGHPDLKMNFAGSDVLAKQIEQGAPANVYASADQNWMTYLSKKNLIVDTTTVTLLSNDLVLVEAKDKMKPVTIGFNFNLLSLLGANDRWTTGNPASVPVGIYAKQALTNLKQWDAAQTRLAPADNVRAALLLVERGEAPVGIVYSTDAATSPNVAIAGTFPASTHDPIAYPFAVTKAGDTPDARALLAFLKGPDAKAAFAKRGFKVN